MGIDGLLKLLKPVTQKQHISEFKQKTIAVDAMPWIYKGCYNCAMQLNQNIESIDFVYYILQMISMLKYYNIVPIFVFDGRAVQAKNLTLDKRRKDKQENKQKGLEFLKNNQMDLARKYLQRCIVIDERIISVTMNTLISKDVKFIVAPYEADCQIAKLKRLGMIDAAISQDSDLVAFGVNVILKLNQNGECDYIDLTRWRPKDVTDKYLKYFLGFNDLHRINAAVLAGTDYNKSVKGIGIKRAIKLLANQGSVQNVIRKLRSKKVYEDKIPEDYDKIVERSRLIFTLSTVYNPQQKKLEFLRPQLLDELKPEQMTLQQLYDIVGVHYQFTQEVSRGRISSKTLQRRQIKMLDFPQIFKVNRQNMMVHEAMIKNKKIETEKLRKQKQEEDALKGIDQDLNQLDKFMQLKARTNNRMQMQEQDKQKRKQERKNRINKLHEMMNTVIEIVGFSDSSQNQQSDSNNEQSVQIDFEKKQKIAEGSKKKANLNTNTKEDKQIELTSEKSDNSDDEEEICDFGNLNPFARNPINIVTLKPQHINGSKKK